MIVVNFKTYKEATGLKAVKLARLIRQIMDETKVRIVAVPQLADLRACVEEGAECWVQHVDPVQQGKTTGWITVEDVEEAGAHGTLLNHSEHKLPWETLQQTMSLISGMAFEACVCADSLEEAIKLDGLKPDWIAYEPPELIGSKDKSVASENPEIITQVVKAVIKPVLIGAGVHSREDIRTGLSLGAKGVLLATDVVLAEDPETELRELAQAFEV
jgi:triosephosphate isomerase (TIM)